MAAASIPWPLSYRRLVGGIAVIGLIVTIAAIASGGGWYSPVALVGGVTAIFCGVILLHMKRRPMLAIDEGALVCRLAAAGEGSANLTREWRCPLDSIKRIEREIRPWPNGERHVYWLHTEDGRVHELLPRPADEATRMAMATLFDQYVAGRVSERRA